VIAIIPLLSHKIAGPVMDGLPELRVVANYAVGYDNVDVPAAAARGIIVTNTPDVLTDATADLTWALLLAATRRLREGLELATSGDWEGWAPGQLLGMELRGKTLGLLGAGRIGRAVAARASGFGMEVTYWDQAASAELEAGVGAARAETLEELLSHADVVSVHLPLTNETHGLLGARELAGMKAGSVLVNTARGEIVTTAALVHALSAGPLAAAGLDVYETEPDVPKDLRRLPNAIVLPHLGSATREARRGMWRVAADNVRRVLSGEPPLTPV
jgi:glyoxylate reductase